LIIGLSRGVTKAHIVRATLEAIALRTKDIIDAVEKAAGVKIVEMKIDGGVSQNNLVAQMMADYMNAKIVRPLTTEATSIGAAQFAGLYTGFYKKEDFKVVIDATDRVFEPEMSEEERDAKYSVWKEAVIRSMGWANL
jgi:glycerol kinase